MVAKAAAKTEEAKTETAPATDTAVAKSFDIDQELARPFSSDVLKKLSKGGQSFDYVPVSEVIARLNFVLGTDGWQEVSSEVYRDAQDPSWVVAKVVLAKRTINLDGTTLWVTKHGYGGAQVKTKKDGGILDLGDDFKGAHSDAFKKAATQLGVGLDISRSEDAMAAEQQDRQRIEDDQQPVATEADLRAIRELIDGLQPDQKTSLGRWWKDSIPYGLDSGKLTNAHTARIREYMGV